MPAYRDTRSGRWRYRKVIQLPDGRKTRLSGTPTKNTKQAAEEAERQHAERALDAFYKQQYLPPSQVKEVPTFAAWFEGRFWREWVIGRKNKPSEQASKQHIYQKHLRDRFGALRLDQIRAGEIAQLRAALVERGLADKSINNVLVVLSKALRYAADVELIEAAPRIGLIQTDRPEIVCWTIEEYARLLAAAEAEGARWYAAVCLAGEAGLRVGEVKALRWQEGVDLVAGTITVSQQVRRGILGTPKGRTRRVVPMTTRLSWALQRLESTREGYVLRNWDGGHLRDARTWQILRRICVRAGLPRRGWHTLRHTFGTHAAYFGVNPWRLMHWMGHKRMEETMRYVHLAEAPMRPLPTHVVLAGQGIADSDQRVLAMLSSRGNLMATGSLGQKELA